MFDYWSLTINGRCTLKKLTCERTASFPLNAGKDRQAVASILMSVFHYFIFLLKSSDAMTMNHYSSC